MQNENDYISIGQASKILGVSVVTLRRWEKLGKLISKFRTFGKHRRYYIFDVQEIISKNKRLNICYARVSSHDQKKCLKRLMDLIIHSKIDTIYLTHKDRLLRFGSELVINIAKKFGTKVEVLNNKICSFEEQLANDVLEIITVCSARLYGSRSHKNKKTKV